MGASDYIAELERAVADQGGWTWRNLRMLRLLTSPPATVGCNPDGHEDCPASSRRPASHLETAPTDTDAHRASLHSPLVEMAPGCSAPEQETPIQRAIMRAIHGEGAPRRPSQLTTYDSLQVSVDGRPYEMILGTPTPAINWRSTRAELLKSVTFWMRHIKGIIGLDATHTMPGSVTVTLFTDRTNDMLWSEANTLLAKHGRTACIDLAIAPGTWRRPSPFPEGPHICRAHSNCVDDPRMAYDCIRQSGRHGGALSIRESSQRRLRIRHHTREAVLKRLAFRASYAVQDEEREPEELSPEWTAKVHAQREWLIHVAGA